MHIGFHLSEKPFLEFDLVEYQKVENLQVHHLALARNTLKNRECYLDKELLHGLLKHHMGGAFSLEEYIEFIKENGFYSPYQSSLYIMITE